MRIPKTARILIPGKYTGATSDDLVGRSSWVSSRLAAWDVCNSIGLPLQAYQGLPFAAFITIYGVQRKPMPQVLSTGLWLQRTFAKRLWKKPFCVHLEARLVIVSKPELECIEVQLVRRDL